MAENAVVYARYSSRGQTEQSIEGQLSAAYKYAEEHGYTIVHEYCDRAVSGRTDNREEFQRMLTDCATHQFSVIIVWKVDRFGRNREEIALNKYRAKRHGVRVEYVAENLPQTAESVILESVLEGMAEYYSLQLSQNVRRGLMESAKKHHVTNGPTPYGYDAGSDKTYVVNEAEAAIVRSVFDAYTTGSTLREIADELNAKGLRTKSGRPFQKTSIATILRNEKYIGTYRYKDYVAEDVIPAIVDRKSFEAVQERLKTNQQRRAPKSRMDRPYLLSGKLFCGICGSPMPGVSGYGKLGVKYGYYTCGRRWREKTCPKHSVPQDPIEAAVLDAVRDTLSEPATLDALAVRIYASYEAENKDTSQREALETRIHAAERSISQLLRAIEMGALSESLMQRLNDLETEKTELQKALTQASLEAPPTLTEDMIRFFLSRIVQYGSDDTATKQRLIDTFVKAAYAYDDGRLVIELNYASRGADRITLEDVNGLCSTDDQPSPLYLPCSNPVRLVKGHVLIAKKIPEL